VTRLEASQGHQV